MQRRELSRQFRNIAALSAASLILGGCLTGEEDASSNDDLITQNRLTGSVGDGPVVGATVRVVSIDGVLLAESASDVLADYSVMVQTEGRSYPLLIDARGGIDVVTNQAPDFVLLGAVLSPDDQSVANINPFSTLAVETARELPGGITPENLALAEDHVVAAISSGLSTTASTGPMQTRINASNVAEVVKASESLGEIIRRVRSLQQAFGRPASGDSVLQALASDLVDGVIDGRGGARVDARVSALATVVAVQVLLESMQNELHVNGRNATYALESAIVRVAGAGVDLTLDDLVVTPAMLDSVNVGLLAMLSVEADRPGLQSLADATAGIQSGMDPMLIKTLVPDGYRQTLDHALISIAGSSNGTIDTINDIARNAVPDPDPINNAPSISGNPPTSVQEGSDYSFIPASSDADNDALLFSISNQPSWADFDVATGVLSGTPSPGDARAYPDIVISVADDEFTSSLPAFTITVTAPAPGNSPPTISGNPPTLVQEGTSYAFTPVASDPDGDALTFSIQGMPGWAQFNGETGELSGSPTAAHVGDYTNIRISVADTSDASDGLVPFSITVSAPPPANRPPTIFGNPPTSIQEGGDYSFTPNAGDPDNDALTFSIQGMPVWAQFNEETGELSGSPTAAHVGVYTNIRISVADTSNASDDLAPFSITVNAISLGSVTLNWMPPTQNEDGTTLTDLAGYKIYWGTSPGSYPNSVTLNNAGLSSYVVENLAPGTYEFVAKSFNTSGVESAYSNPATRVVN